MSDNPDAPPDVGSAPTAPGQTEVIAGTVEHAKLLNLYPNASSYGPDHNVVMGPPVNVDVPHVQQADDTLTCTMGNWTNEPTSYVYQWVVDGSVIVGDGTDTYVVSADDIGHSMFCVVSASNDAGSTMAPASNAVVVA